MDEPAFLTNFVAKLQRLPWIQGGSKKRGGSVLRYSEIIFVHQRRRHDDIGNCSRWLVRMRARANKMELIQYGILLHNL